MIFFFLSKNMQNFSTSLSTDVTEMLLPLCFSLFISFFGKSKGTFITNEVFLARAVDLHNVPMETAVRAVSVTELWCCQVDVKNLNFSKIATRQENHGLFQLKWNKEEIMLKEEIRNVLKRFSGGF